MEYNGNLETKDGDTLKIDHKHNNYIEIDPETQIINNSLILGKNSIKISTNTKSEVPILYSGGDGVSIGNTDIQMFMNSKTIPSIRLGDGEVYYLATTDDLKTLLSKEGGAITGQIMVPLIADSNGHTVFMEGPYDTFFGTEKRNTVLRGEIVQIERNDDKGGATFEQIVSSNSINSIVKMTSASYNALPVKDESTMYVIVG